MRLLVEAELLMPLHSADRRTRQETSSHLVFLLEMFGSTLMYFRCEVHYEAVSREREREDRRARQATLLLCDRHPRPSRSTMPGAHHNHNTQTSWRWFCCSYCLVNYCTRLTFGTLINTEYKLFKYLNQQKLPYTYNKMCWRYVDK